VLIGIAIDEHKLSGVDAKFSGYCRSVRANCKIRIRESRPLQWKIS